MLDLIHKGGPIMWVLLFCSITALALIIERGIFWIITERKKNSASIDRIFKLTEAGQFESALTETQKSNDLSSIILQQGLAERSHGLAESLEVASLREIEKMKRFLSILDTIITAAPLLGILGTVSGIIISFDLLGDAGIEDPKAVTGGIAQALITTATGLSIAICTLVPYNALNHKIEKTTREIEQLITLFTIAVKKGNQQPCD